MTTSPAPRKILIGVAWPYVNGLQHIGHIAGAHLPPDIFARFQRMIGNDVLMVSGSDTHGTPITIKADEEGKTPIEVVNHFHPRFIDSYLKLGLTYDLYTHTDTENHWAVTQNMFLRHKEKGYIYSEWQKQLFDPKDGRFLPDRYVIGTCPKCGFDSARGDQCDNCGTTYEAIELKNPRSKISGNKQLEIRETEHFFLDLGKANGPLLEWWNRDGKENWRTHIAAYTKAQLEERSLRGRPITRDLTWGITIPLPGYESKRFYVWYDAVIGYLSGAKEWAKLVGDAEKWREWWDPKVNPDARGYYFIGKDNISFHSIIWPAMLLAHGGLHPPYDVPANQYLLIRGDKFSKSFGRIIGIQDVLERYQPDAWRYALTAMAPETADVNFTWEDFVERVNSELIAKWGNLVNRMMPFAFKRFEQKVPVPGAFDEVDQKLLAEIKGGFETVRAHYDAVKFRAAAIELMRLSDLVNLYITQKAPFNMIKTDVAATATVVYTVLQAVTWLNTMWSPILPHTAQLVHEMLGFSGSLFGRQYTEMVKDSRGEHLVLRYDHSPAMGRWEAVTLPAGQALGEPKAPYVKLDPKTPELEAERAAANG
jgi:methionyl-tRNA synthetase